MIELLATIDLGENYKYTAEVVSAKSSVPDYNNNTDVFPLPYIGTLYSTENKSFLVEFEKKSSYVSWQGKDAPWQMQGRVIYNGKDCFLLSVAHEIPVWDMNNPYQSVNILQKSYSPLSVMAEIITNVNDHYYQGLAFVKSIGVLVNVYIPLEEIGEKEPADFIPSVYLEYVLKRDKIVIGENYKIFVTTDKPCNCLSISFDTVSNAHPQKIAIDGKSFSVKSTTANFSNLSFSNNHEIEVFDWNYANRPLYISAISASFDGIMEIGKSKMLSCGASVIDRGDTELPSFGIISNGGSLSFSDYDDSALNLAQLGYLNDGAKVEIFVADKTVGFQKSVGDFYSDTWNYDNNAKSVSVSLKDDLEELQDIVFEGLEYNFETRETKTAKQIYEFLYSKTPQKFGFVSFDYLSASTKSVLEETIVKFPYLEKGNLWSAWVKLCELCQLYIFKEYGKTKCEYRGGS